MLEQMEVTLVHWDHNKRHEPDDVLAFCWFQSGVIWVRHPKRGWEVPGGKVESHETPEDAIRREVWEEAGATVGDLVWVGEYVLETLGREVSRPRYKWVYTTRVRDVATRPWNSEIVDVCVPRPVWTPEGVMKRSDVSFVMKDAAFTTLWPRICNLMPGLAD